MNQSLLAHFYEPVNHSSRPFWCVSVTDDDDEVVLDGHRHIMVHLLCFLVVEVLLRDRSHRAMRSGASRNEKISNKSSFGIIDIADDSSTTDRIIVIVDTVRLIHDGAYR